VTLFCHFRSSCLWVGGTPLFAKLNAFAKRDAFCQTERFLPNGTPFAERILPKCKRSISSLQIEKESGCCCRWWSWQKSREYLWLILSCDSSSAAWTEHDATVHLGNHNVTLILLTIMWKLDTFPAHTFGGEMNHLKKYLERCHEERLVHAEFVNSSRCRYYLSNPNLNSVLLGIHIFSLPTIGTAFSFFSAGVWAMPSQKRTRTIDRLPQEIIKDEY
jgi:hypothetical protein